MRRMLELAALALLLTVVVLATIIVTRGQVSVTTRPAAPAAQAAMASSASPAVKAQASLPCPPPPGEGVVGACTPKPVQVFGSRVAKPKVLPATVDPPVCIPDVSSWQGSVDWGAVKAWQVARGCHPAGIFKMGEYVTDPWAAHNNSELARLGMWRAGYWFLRNTGCAHEAQQIISAGKTYGLKVVVLDDETPEAAGYDGCLTPPIKAAGFIVAEYASPGAYPGGARSDNPAWIAAYGPATPPAAPWGGPIKAFQCSDGVFGCVTFVPGIGRDDVSVDYGITSLGVTPPDPFAFLLKTRFTFGHDHASEYNTVKAWYANKCENPARRIVCRTTRAHLILLRDRLWHVAHENLGSPAWGITHAPDWKFADRGRRLQAIEKPIGSWTART